MGRRFDEWLAQPSTIHFLRQLLNTDQRVRAGRPPSFHRQCRCESRYVATLCTHLNGDTALQNEVSEHPSDWSIGRSNRPGKDIHRLWQTGEVYTDSRAKRNSACGSKGALGKATPVQLSRGPARNKPSKENVNKSRRRTYALQFDQWTYKSRFKDRQSGFAGVPGLWQDMQMQKTDLPVSVEDHGDLWSAFCSAVVPDLPKAPHARRLRDPTMLRISPSEARAAPLSKPYSAYDMEGHEAPLEPKINISQSMSASEDQPPGKTPATNTEFFKASARLGMKHFEAKPRPGVKRVRALPTPGNRYRSRYESKHFPFSPDPDVRPSDSSSAPDAKDHPAMPAPGTEKPEAPGVSDSHVRARATRNVLLGEAHGIKEKRFSDGFCAKIVATRLLSTDMVIRIFGILAITSLGPTTLRELALRATSSGEFMESVQRLRTSGVAVKECIFARLLLHVAAGGEREELYRTLLESDQHPEEYENLKTQEQLLRFYLSKNEWPHVQLTILGLSFGKGFSLDRALNCLLQHYTTQQYLPPVKRLLDAMKSKGVILTNQSLCTLFWKLCPPRRSGKREMHMANPDLFGMYNMVTGAYMHAAAHGQRVRSPWWNELLKRYGMNNKMDEVEHLALWLAEFYSADNQSRTQKRLARQSLSEDPATTRFEAIFTRQMIMAIVIWGWRAASRRDLLRPTQSQQVRDFSLNYYTKRFWASESCEFWARGIQLLKLLRDLGHEVETSAVCEGVTQQLWMLFGPAYSALAINQQATMRNHLSLVHYVRHANEIWPGLIEIDERLLTEDMENQAELLRVVFGPVRRVSHLRQEYVNVEAWAASTATPSVTQEQLETDYNVRRTRWRYSPFKIYQTRESSYQRTKLWDEPTESWYQPTGLTW